MSVRISGMTKDYGQGAVVSDLSVEFAAGKISVLLGASGCGKTTTLRCIAGLETPSVGDILIEGREVFSSAKRINLPPEKRNLGMVFQSYAIWPHMTVAQNVGMPLRARGWNKKDKSERISEILRMVGLDGFADRGATQLSGGQQQRVAIARCIASHPKLILMDEPLSNLDAKLRVSMRTELRDLQRRLNATVVFVTHDQEEAMSLADEIFLFHEGKIVQHGSPEALYAKPQSRFVAEFLGKANLFSAAVVADSKGGRRVVAQGPSGVDRFVISETVNAPAADDLLCMVRPETWRLGPSQEGGLNGKVRQILYLGDRKEVRIEISLGEMTAISLGSGRYSIGETIGLIVPPEDLHFVPCEDGAHTLTTLQPSV